MLISALGPIGAEIARLARLLGLKIIGVRRRDRAGRAIGRNRIRPTNSAELLPRCDWLTIACPLTAETRGMIDASLLDRLPRGARFINISRGEIVDEPALIAALESGAPRRRLSRHVCTGAPARDFAAVGPAQRHRHSAQFGRVRRQRLRINALFLDNLKRWQDKPAAYQRSRKNHENHRH